MIGSRKISTIRGDVTRNEYSISFGGTDEYIDCGNDSSLQLMSSTGLTYMAWIKTTDDSSWIISKRNSSHGTLSMYLSGLDKLQAYYGTAGETISTASINDGEWHHVGISVAHDQGGGWDVFVYSIDGEVDSYVVTSRNFSNDSNNLQIGGRVSGAEASYFIGNIAEVVVYERKMDIWELKTMYNNGEPFNHMGWKYAKDLKGWWRMGDGIEPGNVSATVPDMSSNSNDGTMTNMEVVSGGRSQGDYSTDTP